ncbi:hypothetical protein ACQPTN_21385 [Bradyrhizobium sp. 13971]
MSDLEDLFVREARRQGYQPDQRAMRQAAVDLAGSSLTGEGLVAMPGRGSISPADLVRSLRNQMPESFESVDDEPRTDTLTERWRREVAAGRKQASPTDWSDIRSRMTGVTGRFMDEIAAARREGK